MERGTRGAGEAWDTRRKSRLTSRKLAVVVDEQTPRQSDIDHGDTAGIARGSQSSEANLGGGKTSPWQMPEPQRLAGLRCRRPVPREHRRQDRLARLVGSSRSPAIRAFDRAIVRSRNRPSTIQSASARILVNLPAMPASRGCSSSHAVQCEARLREDLPPGSLASPVSFSLAASHIRHRNSQESRCLAVVLAIAAIVAWPAENQHPRCAVVPFGRSGMCIDGSRKRGRPPASGGIAPVSSASQTAAPRPAFSMSRCRQAELACARRVDEVAAR